MKNNASSKYAPASKTKWVVLFIAISLVLILIWNQFPRYASCASYSTFGSYEQKGVCIIPGDLVLEGKVEALPKNLHVQGNLEIRGTSISNLPATLRTDGDVYLYKTAIGNIPENTYIGGSFNFDLGFGSPTIYCDEIPSTAVIKGIAACE